MNKDEGKRKNTTKWWILTGIEIKFKKKFAMFFFLFIIVNFRF